MKITIEGSNLWIFNKCKWILYWNSNGIHNGNVAGGTLGANTDFNAMVMSGSSLERQALCLMILFYSDDVHDWRIEPLNFQQMQMNLVLTRWIRHATGWWLQLFFIILYWIYFCQYSDWFSWNLKISYQWILISSDNPLCKTALSNFFFNFEGIYYYHYDAQEDLPLVIWIR